MVVVASSRNISRLPKRHLKLISAILVVAAFFLLQYLFLHSGRVLKTAEQYLIHGHRKLRVAVVNTQLCHDEVLVPLLDAWLRVPYTQITTYQVGFRFEMEKVITDSGLAEEIKDHIYAGEFKKVGIESQHALPDIVISTTCIKDSKHINETLQYLLNNYHTHFFCLFHHADELENRQGQMIIDRFTPFVRAGRMDFVALSPHVAEFARNDQFSRKWKVVKDELHHPRVRVFPPVFNFKSVGNRSNISDRAKGFAIQGEYEKGRDYKKVFSHMERFIGAAKNRGSADKINLHLVGFGEHPRVPRTLQKHVIFDERLEYTDFYNTLRQSEVILPAFKIEAYYLTKASSTIPASLIAGTPLIGDKRLLRTYDYLDESIMWMQKRGETEMDTVVRILSKSQEERDEKRAKVLQWTEKMVKQNHDNVLEWAEQAVAKFPRDWYRR